MKDELANLIYAYQLYYGLTTLQAIKAITQDLTTIARNLKPVKSGRGTK